MNSKSLSNNPRSHPKKPNPSSNLSRDNLLYIFNFLRSHSSDQFLSSWSRPIIPSFSTCKPHRGSIVFEHFIRFRGGVDNNARIPPPGSSFLFTRSDKARIPGDSLSYFSICNFPSSRINNSRILFHDTSIYFSVLLTPFHCWISLLSRRPLYYYTIVKCNGFNFLITRYFVQTCIIIGVIYTYVCYSFDFNLISAIDFI